MTKRSTSAIKTSAFVPGAYSVDPTECPFREFRDNELQTEFWGMEESNGGRMSVPDIQLSHTQVLRRSSFCRDVLSACFMLERTDNVIVRCYLVRLYYLGAWRCVWVSDQVPVDATGAPLLPFSPLLSKTTVAKSGIKQEPSTVTAQVVCLWTLLICKALLKLAAPDMNSDELTESPEDEKMPEFNVLHALTGAVIIDYKVTDEQSIWELIASEVPMFSWDGEDDMQTSTVKSRSTKKLNSKETTTNKLKGSMVYVILKETKDIPPYHLPGITPSCEMSLLVSMARDLPLKKPLPEPEVAPWKHIRWVDWARKHGLYEAYDCPRTRYLKVNGLMKLSYAPHLLDVQSTDSITVGFIRAEISKTTAAQMKYKAKDTKSTVVNTPLHVKEELREWIRYDNIYSLIKTVNILYYPSMFTTTSATNSPPTRITKVPLNKALDIQAPKSGPLYLQIDGPDTITLKISLNTLHPRILANSGVLIADYVESAYVLLESFEWFKDSSVPKPKAFVKTIGYNTTEVKFKPGRHFCRVWIHSGMNWHMMLLSESSLLLGPRSQIFGAAVRECPWSSKFLLTLGSAFSNWLRINRSNHLLSSVQMADREFFKHYNPDLPWDNDVVGYGRAFRHWMFRQALQAHLSKKLLPADKRNTYTVLRKYFCDPNFGLSQTKLQEVSLWEIAETDPCACLIPGTEERTILEEGGQEKEEAPVVEDILISPEIMTQLLLKPKPPTISNICELATQELPCGILKAERNRVIRNHEAATIIQANWRGMWTRKCLNANVVVTPEVMRVLSDTTCGSQEAVMSLMNEFFKMYPGAKYAYSVASALSGIYGLRQYQGTSPVTPKCKWIPYFQGVFFCHAPVQVHFDVISSLHHSTIAVYDNDTGLQLPQAFNTHKTFNFNPNMQGYTIMGHGSLKEAPGIKMDVPWQFTVLSSLDGVFHVCDNEEMCREIQLSAASKMHIDEIFLPNRRNILGGMNFSVISSEAVSFRTAVTSPDLKIVATLRSVTPAGFTEVISKCSGVGEIFWPYIRLESSQPKRPLASAEFSDPSLNMGGSVRSVAKSANKNKPLSGRSTKSANKLKMHMPEPTYYSIEVTAPSGWPLTIHQWRRVNEVRNSKDFLKPEGNAKIPVNFREKAVITKQVSLKDRAVDKQSLSYPTQELHPGDAYVELECSLTVGGGITVRRDDQRDLEFAAAVKSWDENEPGRNQRGTEIRKQFREEYLEVPAPPESLPNTIADVTAFNASEENEFVEEDYKKQKQHLHGPSPATESSMIEISIKDEEVVKYLEMPEQLRDKFTPLHFIPLCTKELSEDGCVLITSDKAEAAKKDRHARIEAALKQMRELQSYNEVHVLGQQKVRSELLEKLNVEACWSPGLQRALEKRDEAIVQETLLRTHSTIKKNQGLKSKK